MAALAPVQSLLHLDDALVAIPEDATCCSTSQPAAPLRWVDHEQLMACGEGRVRPLRKCASVPTLHSMQEACGDSEGMEVFVILRPFKVRCSNIVVGWPAATRRSNGHKLLLCSVLSAAAVSGLAVGFCCLPACCTCWSATTYLPLAAERRRCTARTPATGVWRRAVPAAAQTCEEWRARLRPLPLPGSLQAEGRLAGAGAAGLLPHVAAAWRRDVCGCVRKHVWCVGVFACGCS